MDGHLPFPQGQEPAQAQSSPAYVYSDNTTTNWPVVYHQNMAGHHGHSSTSSSLHNSPTASLDMRSSQSSPENHSLPSPAFAYTNPVPTTSGGPSNVLNAPLSLDLSPQLAGSISPLQLGNMAGGMAGGQLGSANLQIRTSMGSSQPSIMSNNPTLHQALQASATMLQSFPLQAISPQSLDESDSFQYATHFGMPLHSSPTEDFIPTTQTSIQPGLGLLAVTTMDPMTTMAALAAPPSAYGYQDYPVMPNNFHSFLGGITSAQYVDPPMAALGSPEQALLISRSLSNTSDGDHSWTIIDSLSDHHAALSPLHNRSDSSSSHFSDHGPRSAASDGSFEDIVFHVSPEPESCEHPHVHGISIQGPRHYPFESQDSDHPIPSPPLPSPRSVTSAAPLHALSSVHSPADSSSPPSQSPSVGTSPKTNRRSTPPGITPKIIAKKKSPMATSVREKSEKKVGRRKGPLRPEQREQAHQIRKLRACIRCKYLKKVCDQGNPCGGCQPSHARLWQVPCTRLDVKDIGYFIKDWTADYERHVTLGFSIANIKSFDSRERLLYITHGYGYVMPIWAREVFVRDDSCFGVDWIEQRAACPQQDFETQTARLTSGAEGISKKMVSDYVDLHLDSGFEHFINEYFEGTPFLSDLLKSINKHYLVTKQESLRKGLRLVIAYALTLHVTMINGLSEEESAVGKIESPASKFFGQTCAPVMINFEVKKAMAELWRELMTEVLAELSTLYNSVYTGHKQKSWPTIFMMAALLLSVWEMMQFDCHYRIPDEGAVSKFCDDMEHVPVGVIVGLFGAISTKLPNFQEWDSRKHGNVFQNNPVVCDTMTEVRSHIEKHESYLRTRNDAKFCRDDFDSLSNKFLSKLVIRA